MQQAVTETNSYQSCAGMAGTIAGVGIAVASNRTLSNTVFQAAAGSFASYSAVRNYQDKKYLVLAGEVAGGLVGYKSFGVNGIAPGACLGNLVTAISVELVTYVSRSITDNRN